MLLLCDIFSTGYSAAYNARRLLDEDDERAIKLKKDGVVVVFGCGPVSRNFTMVLLSCRLGALLRLDMTKVAGRRNLEREEGIWTLLKADN
jgi:hypothetical protein